MISNKDILVGAVKSRRRADCYLNESILVNKMLCTVWSLGLAGQVRCTLVPRAPRTGAGPREHDEPQSTVTHHGCQQLGTWAQAHFKL